MWFRQVFCLLLALACRADTSWPDGDDQLDTDLDLLLDVLRRTRGSAIPPKKKMDYSLGDREVKVKFVRA